MIPMYNWDCKHKEDLRRCTCLTVPELAGVVCCPGQNLPRIPWRWLRKRETCIFFFCQVNAAKCLLNWICHCLSMSLDGHLQNNHPSVYLFWCLCKAATDSSNFSWSAASIAKLYGAPDLLHATYLCFYKSSPGRPLLHLPSRTVLTMLRPLQITWHIIFRCLFSDTLYISCWYGQASLC